MPTLIADEETARRHLEQFVSTVGIFRPAKVAAKLIRQCGRASRVFGAPRHRLDATLGSHHRLTSALRSARWLSLHSFEDLAQERPIIRCKRALTAYLGTAMAQDLQETVRVLYTDHELRLIDVEVVHRGTRHACDIDPGIILRRALELGANGLLLAHNHPSGDPTPSAADLEMTARMAASFSEFNVHLVDHIIVGRRGARSVIWDREG